MNAPEHYAEAERLLGELTSEAVQEDVSDCAVWAAVAIVHALLAIGSELGIPPQPHPAMADLAKRRAQAAADAQGQWSQAVAGGQP